MATNPMKKRAQNAFLIGIVIGLIMTVLVGFLLYKKYSDTKKEYEEYMAAQEAKTVTVLVAKEEIKSGVKVEKENLQPVKVIINMTKQEAEENCYTNINDMYIEKKDDQTLERTFYSKLEIPKGGIISKNLVVEAGKEITADTRIREYNSFVLPSRAIKGDIIDVRLTMPSGADFIVLAKKEILKSDETTVWLNVNEAEMLLMNNAMVENWTIKGSKLYAVQYAEAGLQEPSTITYQPSEEVKSIMENNPNIVDEIEEELANQLNESKADKRRSELINVELEKYLDERDSSAESGFSNETSIIKTHRKDYIDSLTKNKSTK